MPGTKEGNSFVLPLLLLQQLLQPLLLPLDLALAFHFLAGRFALLQHFAPLLFFFLFRRQEILSNGSSEIDSRRGETNHFHFALFGDLLLVFGLTSAILLFADPILAFLLLALLPLAFLVLATLLIRQSSASFIQFRLSCRNQYNTSASSILCKIVFDKTSTFIKVFFALIFERSRRQDHSILIDR